MRSSRPHPAVHCAAHRAVVLVGLALAGAGCSSGPIANFLDMFGLVPRDSPAFVDEVTPLGRWLEIDIRSARFAGRLFVSDQPVCREVVDAPELRYDAADLRGFLYAGTKRCEVLGVGSLEQVRDRQPRSGLRGRPRGHATYRRVEETETHVMLRGEFALAGLLGWLAAGDTIAVIERRPTCEGPLARESSAYEYREYGPFPLVLMGDGGDCPILGLIAP